MMMETSSRSRIRCEEHPSQQIANYCCNFNCLKPLCPECVELHTRAHAKQEIESWKNCLNKSHRNIKSTITRLKEILARMSQASGGKTIEAIEDEAMRRLAHIRKDMHDLVDEIMSQHEKEVKIIINSEFRNTPTDLTKLKLAIEELDKLTLKLSNTNTVLGAIKKSILLDHESLVSHFEKEYRNRPERDEFRDEFPISVESEGFTRLRKMLNNIVLYSREPRIQINKDFSRMAVIPNQEHRPAPRQPVHSQPLSIGMGNYFRDNNPKLLHFFVPFSNQLKILPLSSVVTGGSPRWKTIRLNIKSEIPSFYKSIVTPEGEIYLTGGSGDKVKLNTIYKYNQEKVTLDFVGTMQTARSSHAICYSQGNLYIIGGFKPNNEVLTDCEVFNLSSKKSRQIASLCFPSANSCANTFNDERIFKFGGVHNRQEPSNHIEMYLLREDTWTVIDPTLERFDDRLWLLSFSACVQINPNEMFIFGGYNDSEDEASSNLSYVLRIDENGMETNYTIKNIDHFPLPEAEGFWDNNPIVEDGCVVALQNITDTDQVSSLIDERRILIFDGARWKSF